MQEHMEQVQEHRMALVQVLEHRMAQEHRMVLEQVLEHME